MVNAFWKSRPDKQENLRYSRDLQGQGSANLHRAERHGERCLLGQRSRNHQEGARIIAGEFFIGGPRVGRLFIRGPSS